MNWQDFLAALALVMVLEGLLPFFSPRGFKNTMQQMVALPDQALRFVGLGLMLVGLAVLYLVRG